MIRLLTLVIALVVIGNADAGCRGRRGGCRPSNNNRTPCAPVASAVNATANVLAAPVRVLGGCVGGTCR